MAVVAEAHQSVLFKAEWFVLIQTRHTQVPCS